MSNQRPGKVHAAAMSTVDRIDLMKLNRFFKDAVELLNERGEEDAAHYFEVVGDYFREDYKGGDIATAKALAL